MATIAIVNHERCVGCELCARACGVTHAIQLNIGHNWVEVTEDLCWACGACERMCPFSAIALPPWAEANKELRDKIYAQNRKPKKSRVAAQASVEGAEEEEEVFAGQSQ
ncbi:MAG: 4Fe-4S binding protein [Firmicutes bacterium]|nr:4Fe-4S binding protein [Bacillota bacterium]